MKFGYRDRIILLIVCVIIIFGIGIFVFIKPKYEDLKSDKASRDKLRTEWSKQLSDFELIPHRQDKIKENFEESTKLAENFTDEMNSVELDEFLQEQFMNSQKYIEDEVKLRSAFTVTDEKTTAMNYYYYTPSIVTYPLYEYADMDGSLAEAAAEKRKASDVLSARGNQTVGVGNSTFTIQINREDTMALLDAVRAYAVDHSDAMLIRSVSLAEYSFNTTPGAETTTTEEGEEQTAETTQTDLKKGVREGYTDVTINYEVYYMQEPTEPDVGPEYDKTIWDGKDWKDENYAGE